MAQPSSQRSQIVKDVDACDFVAIDAFLAKGADSPENGSDFLAEVLTVACEYGRPTVAEHVLARSVDAPGNTQSQRSPLEIAASLDRLDVVQLLIKHRHSNEQLTAWRKRLRSSLALAKSEQMAELLIHNGANIESLGDNGSSILMEVSAMPIIELLVSRGVSLDAKDNEGRTALRRTVELDQDESKATFLIDKTDADLEAGDNEGRTVLMTAVWKSRRDVFDQLLPRVKVDAKDEKGRVAIHHLASDKDRTYDYQPDLRAGENARQQDIDLDMLDQLLDRYDKPNATDKKGRTCLHWAAAMGCSGLLKGFLQTGRFNQEATDLNSKTPLHSAAAQGHLACVKALLDQGVSFEPEDDRAWTPLHHACKAKNDVLSSVELLLSLGADPNKKTKNSRTPLHLAASEGNLEIVRTLLKRKDIKRNARDMFGNTALLSAASTKHRNKREIVQLFAPWQEFHTLEDDARRAAKLWNATVVGFRTHKGKADWGGVAHGETIGSGMPDGAGRIKESGDEEELHTSVFELLYDRDPKDSSKPARRVSPSSLAQGGFRWIHLPANNVAWCQDLFAKYYVEEGTMDVNSFKALERSFNQQRGGKEPQSRYMSSTTQPVVRPWGNEEGGTAMGDRIPRSRTFDQEPNKSSHPPWRLQKSEADPRGKARFSDRTETFASMGSSNDERAQNLSPSSPTRSQSKPEDALISDFYVFMPYLHFETYDKQRDMTKTHTDIISGTEPSGGKISQEKDVALFQAHLNTPEHSLHIRRTLDQSFYHHINTAERRDDDQVIHRFQRDILKCESGQSKIIMVDQLWMWVIGENLIVTSFPPRWDQPDKDPMNLLEYVLSIIHLDNRAPIRSVFELAMIISGRCYGAYDRHGIGSEEPHFLDMFEGWIGAAMDDEVKVFNFFKSDSARASEWLRNPHSLRKAKWKQKRKEKHESQKRKEKVREPGFKVIRMPHKTKYPSTEGTFVENLLDIGWETALLEDVKDIRDELGMLLMIFERQEQVREGIEDVIGTILEQRQRPHLAEFRRAIDDHHRTISQPKRETERMQKQAQDMYNSVRDLLDLKQKHANAIEARYAREQTDDSSKQGNILTVFTTVTTIFLPISFIAAFFAINIRGLPHDERGNQVLGLGFILKYIFAVGLTIAAVCVVLALYVEELIYAIKGVFDGEDSDPTDEKIHGASPEPGGLSDGGSDPSREPNAGSGSQNSATTGGIGTGHKTHEAGCSPLQWPSFKRRHQKDLESGTTQSNNNGVNGNI